MYMYVIPFQTLQAIDEWSGVRMKKCKESRKKMAKTKTCTLPNQLQSSQKILLALGLKKVETVSLRI